MIRTSEAKQLCTKTEFELFSTSQSQAVKGLSEAELRKKIQRSRTARDKYRSLAQRQRREARGKQQPRASRPSKSAQRTVRKQQLFDEILTRYQKRLTAIRGKSSRASTTKTAIKKAPKKAAKKKTASKKSAAKKSAAKTKKKSTTTKKTAQPKKKSATTKKTAKRTASLTASNQKTKIAMKKKQPDAKTKSGELIRQRQAGSGLVRKQKHLSSRGKKNQARHDSKSR